MNHQETVSRQLYCKPGVYHLLAQLSEHENAERTAKRRSFAFRALVAACIVLIGLQFL